jgi:hypothetical protein
VIAWDDLAEVERQTRERRRSAMSGGAYSRHEAHRAERVLHRLEMGDDIDD